jgi:hypothetical protein
MEKIPYNSVLKTFKHIGFNEELKTPLVTVLREMEFPFRRITMPNHSLISDELIDLYLSDLTLDRDLFYQTLSQISSNGSTQ